MGKSNRSQRTFLRKHMLQKVTDLIEKRLNAGNEYADTKINNQL